MGRKRLSKEDIELLIDSPEEYARRKNIKLESANALRYKYTNKKELINMESGPEGFQGEELERVRELLQDFSDHGFPVRPEDAPMVKKIQMHEMGYTDEDGEAHTRLQRNVELRPTGTPATEIYEPAKEARITPTKRKRAQRLGKLIMAFGDSQIGYRRVYNEKGEDELIPTHSEEVLSIIEQINAHERPDIAVNLSDTIDLAEFSRFDPDSDNFHRTLSPAFQRVHDFYAQLKADNPDGEFVEVDSNHTARAQKSILKNMPELYGFTLPGEEYPLMSYYRLANLGALGVRFISGYGAAEYVHGEENGAPIVFKHGKHSSATPGATVRKEAAQNPTVHIVRAHGHSYEALAQTTRDGTQLYYIQLGTSCDTKGGVPSYHSAIDDFGRPIRNESSQENWQNQVLMIRDFENGQYEFVVVDITNGVAFYNGERYDGNSKD